MSQKYFLKKKSIVGAKLLAGALAAVLCFGTMSAGVNAASSYALPKGVQTYKGHTYKLYNTSKSWESAEKYCEKLGGHLVTITGAKEQNFIIQQFLNAPEKKNYWIGLSYNHKKNKWTWVTKEKYDYTNWAPKEPNNYSGKDEGYVHLFGVQKSSSYGTKKVGHWNDCGNTGASYAGDFYALKNYGFICEWDGIAPKRPSIAINSAKNKVSGTTSAKAKVYVKIGKKTYTKTADSKGKFKVNTTKLKKGNVISVYAVKNKLKSETLRVKL